MRFCSQFWRMTVSELVYKVLKREHNGLYSVYAKHAWRVKYDVGVPTSGIDGAEGTR